MSGADPTACDVIALIPAAGQATRLGTLPCSKELYPVGYHSDSFRPKAVTSYLLESLRAAGISKTLLILRDGKWDIPAYYGDGSSVGMRMGYLMMGVPYGAAFTLDQAYPFVQDARVALGFPDIIFEPRTAFERLLTKQAATRAEVVLGLFPAQRPHKMDMVETDAQGRVLDILIKPEYTALELTWIIALWTPAFTRFMHAYLARAVQAAAREFESAAKELDVGDVIRAAVAQGWRVETERFKGGRCIDIGTFEDLDKAVQRFTLNRPDAP